MTQLSDFFVGRLRAGQADIENWHGSRLARVEFDRSTWFYELPPDVTLAQFKVAAEVAFECDSDHAEIWGSDGFTRVVFE